jgi:hypothetical protein
MRIPPFRKSAKGFNHARDDVLDHPKLAVLDDLPHSTRDELHPIPRVSLVLQVPLEIGEVVCEGGRPRCFAKGSRTPTRPCSASRSNAAACCWVCGLVREPWNPPHDAVSSATSTPPPPARHVPRDPLPRPGRARAAEVEIEFAVLRGFGHNEPECPSLGCPQSFCPHLVGGALRVRKGTGSPSVPRTVPILRARPGRSLCF